MEIAHPTLQDTRFSLYLRLLYIVECIIMLIPLEDISKVIYANAITFTGALHLGAYECDEINFYGHLGISYHDVVWIEALEDKVIEAKNRGIPNVYNALITDKSDEIVTFNVSNNSQSSSVFLNPQVFYVDKIRMKSTSVNNFFKNNNLDGKKCDFWNLDIQGAELLALKGATEYLKYAKAIYLAVYEKEMYAGCGLIGDIDAFLSEHGFKRVLTNVVSKCGCGYALYIATSCLKPEPAISLTITEKSADEMKSDMKKMLKLFLQLLNQMTTIVNKYDESL
jgi:FkbM family methyltransferase